MKTNLLDVFLFYNELDLLKARLEYLGPKVNYFFITEANVDFSGEKKEFLLNQQLIKLLPFNEKIIYNRIHINLNSCSWILKRIRYRNKKTRLLWKIQDTQRNASLIPLKKFNQNDIVIFSDLDEFPSEMGINEAIKLLDYSQSNSKEVNACSLDQTFFYYNLHNAAPYEKFYGSVVTTLKTFRKFLPHKFRSKKNDLAHVCDGGWHFSYFMDEEKILKKINAIGDVENLSSYKNLSKDDIYQKIEAGIDLYDRGTKFDSLKYKSIPMTLLKILNKHLPYCTKNIKLD
jgi:beta-1,4-mannosyl-glycoprotein beta-1,4-N-acetylglucosaminyltransferase